MKKKRKGKLISLTFTEKLGLTDKMERPTYWKRKGKLVIDYYKMTIDEFWRRLFE